VKIVLSQVKNLEYENTVPGRIFVPNREEVIKGWRE
jgi:hypothetical protein